MLFVTSYVYNVQCTFCLTRYWLNKILLSKHLFVFRISNGRKQKDSEFKAREVENLDKQNLRDAQLSEYEKRKRQMKELDK